MSAAPVFDLEERRRYLGCSEVAAVLGLSRWSTPHKVARLKLGLDEQRENPALEWGNLLEPAILTKWERVMGAALTRPSSDNPLALRDSERPWLRGHLDGITDGPRECPECGISAPKVIVDAKHPDIHTADDWGAMCSDDVPDEYGVQMQLYCGLADVEQADLSVLIGGKDWRCYHVRRDRGLFEELVGMAGAWWHRYVSRGELPPLDGSEETASWLRRRFPRDVAEMIPASPQSSELMERLRDLRKTIDSLEEEKGQVENVLRMLCGEAAGIVGDGWTLHYRKAKDSQRTSWEGAFKALAASAREEDVARAIAAASYLQLGSRRFSPKWKKGA